MRVGRHDVTISNPDKVFFPQRGLTKADLVHYYVDLAGCALNHISRRPFHMKRYPHGVDGEFFHLRRAELDARFPGLVDSVLHATATEKEGFEPSREEFTPLTP